jgi:uncharacterized protein (DUF488 family)
MPTFLPLAKAQSWPNTDQKGTSQSDMQQKTQQKTIWTIGHSTRSFPDFLAILKEASVKCLADIRHYPGSKRYPHFNRETLQSLLNASGIKYMHFKDLGGRRKPLKGSLNEAWKNSAFRGYADYMETDHFRFAIDELESVALDMRTALMCSEAVWWRCHRALVSDYLKARGWKVLHLMGEGKVQEHPYTSVARLDNGKLSYHGMQTALTFEDSAPPAEK